MAKTIKTRIENLETRSPNREHDWIIQVGMDAGGRIESNFYRDGELVTQKEFNQEFKPVKGEPIQITLNWE